MSRIFRLDKYRGCEFIDDSFLRFIKEWINGDYTIE